MSPRLLPAAALVLVCVTASATGADPYVFRLKASKCTRGPATRDGTAFAVQRFRSSQTPVVLVTALHVVHTCKSIQVFAPECHGDKLDEKSELRLSIPSTTRIETWPAYDLAAIGIQDAADLRLPKEISDQIDFSSDSLEALRADETKHKVIDYKVPGISSRKHCLRGFTRHVTLERAEITYEYLARRQKPPANAAQLRGSLSAAAWILNYQLTSEGSSGAPVMLHENKVLAIHIAGFTDYPMGWAIVLAGSRIDKIEPRIASIADWPPVISSHLEQSASSLVTERYASVTKYASRVRRAQNYLGVSLGGGLQGRYAWDGPSTALLRTTYAIHPYVTHTALGYLKLGFTADGVATLSRSRQRFFSPAGELLEAPGAGSWSVSAAPGVDVRLDRMSDWFSPSLSAGVLAGRWFFDSDAVHRDKLPQTNIGAWLSIKNRSPLACFTRRGALECLHWVAALTATWQLTPNLDYMYTGVGGEYIRSGDEFTTHFALEAGLEW